MEELIIVIQCMYPGIKQNSIQNNTYDHLVERTRDIRKKMSIGT